MIWAIIIGETKFFIYHPHSHSHSHILRLWQKLLQICVKEWQKLLYKSCVHFVFKECAKGQVFLFHPDCKSTTDWSIAENAFYHLLITDLTLLFNLTWWEKSSWMRHAKWWLLYGNQVYLELWGISIASAMVTSLISSGIGYCCSHRGLE